MSLFFSLKEGDVEKEGDAYTINANNQEKRKINRKRKGEVGL